MHSKINLSVLGHLVCSKQAFKYFINNIFHNLQEIIVQKLNYLCSYESKKEYMSVITFFSFFLFDLLDLQEKRGV